MANDHDASVDSLLSLHVIGAGVGESIIIQIPHETKKRLFHWGVVDCYSSSAEFTANKTLQYLLSKREVGACDLDFACVTHPHKDHMYGFWHFFADSKVNVNRFWRFDADDPTLLRAVAAINERNHGQHPERKRIQQELELLLEHTKQLRIGQDSSKYRRCAGFNKCIYRRDIKSIGDIPVPLSIAILAPSATQLDKHTAEIAKCFTNDTFDATRYNRQIHNLLSVVLHVQFGETRIILGADAESGSWSDIVSDSDRREAGVELSCHVIKVSHHGSENAIHNDAWNEHAAHAKPTAIIAPYRHSKLPKPNGLSRLHKKATVYVTSGETEEQAVRGSFQSGLLTRRASQVVDAAGQANAITVRVDHVGKVVSVEELAIA